MNILQVSYQEAGASKQLIEQYLDTEFITGKKCEKWSIVDTNSVRAPLANGLGDLIIHAHNAGYEEIMFYFDEMLAQNA